MRKVKQSAPKPLVFYYRQSAHDFRVWRSDWAGYDMFEVMNSIEFMQLTNMLRRFSIQLIEAED